MIFGVIISWGKKESKENEYFLLLGIIHKFHHGHNVMVKHIGFERSNLIQENIFPQRVHSLEHSSVAHPMAQ